MGLRFKSAASPAEAVSGEAIELTAQQVLSREQMLDRVNAGPQRPRAREGVAEPAPPGTESQLGGDLPPRATGRRNSDSVSVTAKEKQKADAPSNGASAFFVF